MAKLNRPLTALPLWWYLLTLTLAGTSAYEAHAWYRELQLRDRIAAPSRITVDDDTPAALLLAKAGSLAQTNRVQEAIRIYHTLLNSEDPAIREPAYYNLATLYLRDGAKLWNAVGVLEYARVNTLVELAKEHFREALRLNPDHWDARFNLEYAWRITPPPKEKPKSDWKGSKSSVFSTLPGLPGGGP